MEAFFVAVTACVLLGVGLWALAAVRRLLSLTEPRSNQPRSSQPRSGDD